MVARNQLYPVDGLTVFKKIYAPSQRRGQMKKLTGQARKNTYLKY